MTDEHNHSEDDSFERIPFVRNYMAWVAVSAGVGAVVGGVLEHYSGSGLGSILLGVGVGALGFVAVFSSTEYTIQKNKYDYARERDERK
ncbi:hypothetical protein J4423_03230 [Candidatus Pacearchaeota archaeon]|nr:hypothetical protein [Candidatus Pacearchaeota archaeon]